MYWLFWWWIEYLVFILQSAGNCASFILFVVIKAHDYCAVLIDRSVLAASAKHCGFWTATGLDRTRRTNSLRWCVWIHSMQPSVTIPTFSGCASRWWSIVRCVDSLQLRASHAASAKVTATARRSAARVALAGNAATLWRCIASDRQDQTTAFWDFDMLACRSLLICIRLSCTLINAVCCCCSL